MKKQTITYEEYDRLKQWVNELPWVWQEYQRKAPDGWYEFKYQGILRQFISEEGGDQLFSQARRLRWGKRVRLPKSVYQDMKELADICLELQDVLAYPPFGSFSLTDTEKPRKEGTL
ncbi:hypothetical protein I6N95_03805 [Vagococcus sp. BWB3-3]|uniref:Uncharacterized protein n=1 Tax=Vagococcus allomyrinae TaxID=2794353 RepID=A0A940P328_9ENTE|nr:hypothetical protein [Vagococcus allomyrinae]MBP1040130.1 hypothetical protein [Vagococcus allomyrinae]